MNKNKKNKKIGFRIDLHKRKDKKKKKRKIHSDNKTLSRSMLIMI